MWQSWAAIPFVMPARKTGRFRKVAALKLIGIEAPEIKGLIEEKGEKN